MMSPQVLELPRIEKIEEGGDALDGYVVRCYDLEFDRRETFNVPIERIVVTDNIRPKDSEVIETIAASIEKHGQLQECIGDIVFDEFGNPMVRLIAGRHRY